MQCFQKISRRIRDFGNARIGDAENFEIFMYHVMLITSLIEICSDEYLVMQIYSNEDTNNVPITHSVSLLIAKLISEHVCYNIMCFAYEINRGNGIYPATSTGYDILISSTLLYNARILF